MPVPTAEEAKRGCRQHSKLYPIAFEVRDLYVAGRTVDQIAAEFKALGITRNMVAGHVNRNGFKRKGVAVTEAEMNRRQLLSEAAARNREKMREARIKLTAEKVAAAKVAAEASLEAKKAPKPILVHSGTSASKRLIDMRNFQCWFHVGGTPLEPADQLFCGCQTNGGMFCEEHRVVAFIPPEARKRRKA